MALNYHSVCMRCLFICKCAAAANGTIWLAHTFHFHMYEYYYMIFIYIVRPALDMFLCTSFSISICMVGHLHLYLPTTIQIWMYMDINTWTGFIVATKS